MTWMHSWIAKEKFLLFLHIKNILKITLTCCYKGSLLFHALFLQLWKFSLSKWKPKTFLTKWMHLGRNSCLLCKQWAITLDRNMFCIVNMSNMKGFVWCNCLQWQGLHRLTKKSIPDPCLICQVSYSRGHYQCKILVYILIPVYSKPHNDCGTSTTGVVDTHTLQSYEKKVM